MSGTGDLFGVSSTTSAECNDMNSAIRNSIFSGIYEIMNDAAAREIGILYQVNWRWLDMNLFLTELKLHEYGAIDWYEDITVDAPDPRRNLASIVDVYSVLSSIEKIKILEKSVIEPMDALLAVHSNQKATQKEEMGNIKAAMKDYKSALSLDPHCLCALYNLIDLLAKEGKLSKALTLLKKLLLLDPKNAMAWGVKAMCLERTNDLINALESYETAHKLDNTSPTRLRNFAMFMMTMKRHERAKLLYEELMLLVPNDGVIIGEYADLLHTMDLLTESRTAFEKALATGSYNSTVVNDYGALLHKIAVETASPEILNESKNLLSMIPQPNIVEALNLMKVASTNLAKDSSCDLHNVDFARLDTFVVEEKYPLMRGGGKVLENNLSFIFKASLSQQQLMELVMKRQQHAQGPGSLRDAAGTFISKDVTRDVKYYIFEMADLFVNAKMVPIRFVFNQNLLVEITCVKNAPLHQDFDFPSGDEKYCPLLVTTFVEWSSTKSEVLEMAKWGKSRTSTGSRLEDVYHEFTICKDVCDLLWAVLKENRKRVSTSSLSSRKTISIKNPNADASFLVPLPQDDQMLTSMLYELKGTTAIPPTASAPSRKLDKNGRVDNDSIVGQIVQITGIISKPELNNLFGIVEDFVTSTERFTVRILNSNNERVRLKMSTINVVNPRSLNIKSGHESLTEDIFAFDMSIPRGSVVSISEGESKCEIVKLSNSCLIRGVSVRPNANGTYSPISKVTALMFLIEGSDEAVIEIEDVDLAHVVCRQGCVVFRRCRFRVPDVGSGLKTTDAGISVGGGTIKATVILESCIIDCCRGAGIITDSSGFLTMLNCSISNNKGAGLEVRNGGSASVSLCRFRSNVMANILGYCRGKSIEIRDCVLQGGGDSSILIRDGCRAKVFTTTITGAKFAGVAVEGKGSVSMEGCTVKENLHGVLAQTGKCGFSAESCEFSQNKGHGIFVGIDCIGNIVLNTCKILGNKLKQVNNDGGEKCEVRVDGVLHSQNGIMAMGFKNDPIKTAEMVQQGDKMAQDVAGQRSLLDSHRARKKSGTLDPTLIVTCMSCDATEKIGEKFSYCGSCKKVSYCSRACQKKHWSNHKHTCRETAKYPALSDPTVSVEKKK